MRVVSTITVEAEVNINEHEVSGEIKYDWDSHGGHESDYLFDTVSEAIADAEMRLS